MVFHEFFASGPSFRTEDNISLSIENSKNYEGEDTNSANLLLFFTTSKQKTYLVATEKRLYCILDDIRKKTPHVKLVNKKK